MQIFTTPLKKCYQKDKKYEMEIKLKNIISTERLRCVFIIDNNYVTVSLPQDTDEKQVTFKFLNKTKIESKLKKINTNLC